MKKFFHRLLLLVALGSLQMADAQAPPDITTAEYFFDTDSGTGNGVTIAIGSPGQTVSFPANVPVTGLLAGSHTLYIRVKDAAGVWSLHQSFPFRIFRQIKKAEYFIDTDPGVGNGTAIPISQVDTLLQNFSVSLTGRLPGRHTLYVRTADVNGVWSLYQAQPFNIGSQVVSGEYFIDTDPGTGMGTAFTLTAAETVSKSLSIPLIGVASGEHWLYTRTKNIEGKWSLPESRRFWIRPQVIAGEYFLDADPGVGKAFPISIAAADTANYNSGLVIPVCTPAGTHQLYVRTRSDQRKWSLYEPQEITIPPNLNPGVVTATITGDTVKCDDGSRLRFYNPGNGKILTSIQHNGLALPGAMVNTYVRPASYSAFGRRFMSRSYVVKTSSPPAGNVRLRLYFTQAELDDYKSGDATVVGITDLNVLGYQGPTEDDIYYPFDATLVRRIDPVATGTEYGAYYLEIETNTFSEFYIIGRNTILPMQLLSFQAQRLVGTNHLSWQTTSESNTAYFEIERSDDGIHFYIVGKVAAAGNSNTIRSYSFDDGKPFSSLVYYRLALYDKDGSTTRSRQVALQQTEKETITLLPNPVTTQAFIRLPQNWQGPVQWKVVNTLGSVILQGKTAIQVGAMLTLSVQQLGSGHYTIELLYNNEHQNLKMIKQ